MVDVPERIGRYEVTRVLGQGAMGVVYKAHDPEIDRDVAVKLIRTDLLDGDERAEHLARFQREAQAAGRCVHPNIVAIFDYALHADNPFLVMEYVRGASLARVLEGGIRNRVEVAGNIVLQLLDALACAHSLGVVHRDVKPANVLLLEGAQVKVTDFGISRFHGSNLTARGLIVGTPSYMSPEQCRGEDVDQRTDLFSTGVVLFELLTGERPFRGRDFTSIVYQLLHQDAPDLHGQVPDGLADVVAKALAKEPEKRFASAPAMSQALREALAAADRTVILAPRARSPEPAPLPTIPSGTAFTAIEKDVLSSLQRRLAEHVGPIAKLLVSSAIRRAESLDALCEMLAENISSGEERQAFLRTARIDLGKRSSQTTTTTALTTKTPAFVVPQAVVEKAQVELSRFMGPIARVLVKRALGSSRSTSEFWNSLAKHIEREADRAAFLRLQPPG